MYEHDLGIQPHEKLFPAFRATRSLTAMFTTARLSLLF